jgi:hypothetical protein
MAIALALGFMEVVVLIVARPAFEMLYLGEQHAAATMDGQRAVFLAAGERVLVTFRGTAFHVSYNLFSVYLLMVSSVMLRSQIFGRVTACVGILAAILNWGHYVPGFGIHLSVLSLVPLAIWNVPIASGLFRRGRDVSEEVKLRRS